MNSNSRLTETYDNLIVHPNVSLAAFLYITADPAIILFIY